MSKVQNNSQNKALRRQIATVRKKKNQKTGEDMVMVVFDKKVQILFDGQEADLGEYRTLFLKSLDQVSDNFDYRVSKGYMSEDEKQERLSKLEEKNVKYTLEVPLKV